ncbi:tetratricopeptide repeat protein [Streptomyces sp. NPDC057623]|uniref:tetratricopeptide repeat protein n=1 Tax=Streptomyces sp. NPDC057623 TaxID=3346187 RepID=UPI0036C211C7
MAQSRPSMQELIRLRRRAGFVGRSTERAAFRENLDLRPEDERHRFLFHVHGDAGVGKTFLVRELEQIARERGALTAYVDESVGSVPEAMAAISRQFAAQGFRFKDLDRQLAAHRERRHEAEAAFASLGPEPEGPSTGSTAVIRAGLVGLGMVPGVGAFAGALDAAQLAEGADRLRAGLSARLRNQDDVQLVLAPERVLTPVLLTELSDAASEVPWIVLFFDTYERTGPLLDGWLHEVMTTDRYGTLPATVVVVTAGQHPFDAARWGGFADFMTDVALGPFTESEARGLLADKGVAAEPVVEEVLRLTGGLPVLVSTLAEQRPTGPDDIGDPSATAVERFLRWEQDPVRRAVALACALPRRLDMDVFRGAVDCPETEADELFGWLRGLAFVDDRGDRLRYHELVREQMLRLQRNRSRRGWTERHERLADAFRAWREDSTRDLRSFLAEWDDEQWRELRLEETYHSLCARPQEALAGALRDLVGVSGMDKAAGHHWARMLEDAGDATDSPTLRDWGRRLREALADDTSGVVRAMDLLLSRPGLDRAGRALAHTVRGRRVSRNGEHGRAWDDYDRAIELDPDLFVGYAGRGIAHRALGDMAAALADFDRALQLFPDDEEIEELIAERAETYRQAGRFEEAIADYDRAIDLDPASSYFLASRGVCRHALQQYDQALADFDRALSLDEDYVWALVRRARLRRVREEWDQAFTDLDRAVELAPDSAWVASERGDAYRLAGRSEEAVTELGRAVALSPDYGSALASRGAALHQLGRDEEALADLDRAIGIDADYVWALASRARVRKALDDEAGMFEDLHRALEAGPQSADWISAELGLAYWSAGRDEEAIVAFRRGLERDPEYAEVLAMLGVIYRVRGAYTEARHYLDRAVAASPDNGWAYQQRARVCLATGRHEQALADLDRCRALDMDADWAWGESVALLMRCGHVDEALARLSAPDRRSTSDDDLDALRAEVCRHTGRWAEARMLAERIGTADPYSGTFHMALTVGRTQGLRAAAPLWRDLARWLPESGWDETSLAMERCIHAAASGDWPGADRALSEALAADPDWDDLADLVDTLTELLHSPDADRARLTPRVTAAAAARDAVRARYAE